MSVVTGATGLSVYVSGPVHDGASRLALTSAARRLEAAGARATYPLHGDSSTTRRAAREWNVSNLLSADLLVLLPGWESSASAVIDALTADGAGIPRVSVAALENIPA